MNSLKSVSKLSLSYNFFESLSHGQEFNPYDLQGYIRSHGFPVSDGTCTRYIRFYRQDSGKKIICVNRPRSIYKML
ncbi:MAG: hypothetical protein OEV44_02905 [Spirochaetota bacterium]|nr:hypothetical protein [Spirochaetota bacterium]